ncbi:MAG: very short patch repair endonuclease [Candidatus Aenigmarchaeota archaeon]|nr:very short patch repair endonuclease [Candidatus Aenigmarchaeota archaeon]
MKRAYTTQPVGKSPKSNSKTVSKSMKSNKPRGTKPEKILSMLLKKKIERNTLPGNPDFIFPKKKIAVFVNGCFWHKCKKCNLPIPKTNTEFWKRKFERNIERDKINKKELDNLGWKVFEFWEHDIRSNPDKVLGRIKRYVTKDVRQYSP